MKCNAVDMGIKIRHVLAREEEYIHISLYLVSIKCPRLDTNNEKEQIYLRTRTLRHNDRGGVSCVHSRRGETLDTTESVSSGKRLFKQTAGSLPTAN